MQSYSNGNKVQLLYLNVDTPRAILNRCSEESHKVLSSRGYSADSSIRSAKIQGAAVDLPVIPDFSDVAGDIEELRQSGLHVHKKRATVGGLRKTSVAIFEVLAALTCRTLAISTCCWISS